MIHHAYPKWRHILPSWREASATQKKSLDCASFEYPCTFKRIIGLLIAELIIVIPLTPEATIVYKQW
jgi:hypothetical protein